MVQHSAIDHSGLTGIGDVAAHEADTTAVHGITNTANLYASGGTDVAVADGGTGASSASAARTNLGLVIGTDVRAQGSGDPTRATLGLDTTDSPQLAGVNLGHASDTTLTRVSAGVVAIEGTNIVKAGAATGSGLTMATARLLGRTTASSGAIEEIAVGSGLTLSGGTLDTSGGGGGTTITVEEVDGTPTGAVDTLVLPNGTLGIVGSVATYTPAGGGGGGSMSGSQVTLSSGDLTTASTTFVDLTGATITVTTAGSLAWCGFTTTVSNQNSDKIVYFDLDVDGTRQSGVNGGLTANQYNVAGGYRLNLSFTRMVTGLSAGSHTFKVQWRVDGGTSLLRAGTSGEPLTTFWVQYS